MRLLIVTREHHADQRYGLGKSVGRIAAGLSQHGHWVAYRSQADYAANHVAWQPRLAPWLKRLGLGSAVPAVNERLVQGALAAREALTVRATHVWVQDPWLVVGLRLGLWHQRRLGRWPFRLVISQHGLGSFARATQLDGLALTARQVRWLLRLERWAMRGAAQVLLPSKAAADALVRDMSWSHLPAHCQVLGYGSPELTLPHHPTARQQLSTELSVPPGVPLVLAIGRLSPAKCYAQAIEAMVQLEQTYGVSAQLLIAGDGDRHTLCRDAGAEQLRYPPYIRPFDDISACLAAADIYLSTGAVESFGLANREAVAAGLPCVVASGGASDEVLGNGAWLMPATPATLADALHTLLTKPATARFWQRQALNAAAQWHPWNTLIDDYERIFRNC